MAASLVKWYTEQSRKLEEQTHDLAQWQPPFCQSFTVNQDISKMYFFFPPILSVVPHRLWSGQKIPGQPDTTAHTLQRRQKSHRHSSLCQHQRTSGNRAEVRAVQHPLIYFSLRRMFSNPSSFVRLQATVARFLGLNMLVNGSLSPLILVSTPFFVVVVA